MGRRIQIAQDGEQIKKGSSEDVGGESEKGDREQRRWMDGAGWRTGDMA